MVAEIPLRSDESQYYMELPSPGFQCLGEKSLQPVVIVAECDGALLESWYSFKGPMHGLTEGLALSFSAVAAG